MTTSYKLHVCKDYINKIYPLLHIKHTNNCLKQKYYLNILFQAMYLFYLQINDCLNDILQKLSFINYEIFCIYENQI